jgi:branched-chain amino acid aminotransferase
MHGTYIWQNGLIKKWGSGATHVMNPSLHYGIAAFEGIRFYQTDKGPAIFRLKDHLDRFFYSMNVLGMPIAHHHEQLTQAIKELIVLNKINEGYIRPIAWFSDQVIGLHNAGGTTRIQIAIFDWRKFGQDMLRVHISPFLRIHPKTTDVNAKISGHYINTHLALQHAGRNGFDDAILLDHDGNIAEASAANIFCLHRGWLVTPLRGAILPGITRTTVIQLPGYGGLRIVPYNISPTQLLESTEVFLCGTAYEIMPVSHINDTTIGNGTPGPVTSLLQEQYRKAIHGELPERQYWLTYIE